MPKYAIMDLSAEEFAKCMSALGNAASAAPQVTMTAPPPAARAPAPAASPPPQAATPAPPSSVAPPAPPAAPAPKPAAATGPHGAVLTAMQKWGNEGGFKAQGIKRVLAKISATSVTAAMPAEHLTWLEAVFKQQPDGSYLTPEAIEAL